MTDTHADALAALSDAAGILPDYIDVTGQHHHTQPETRAALLRAMGFDPEDPASVHAALDALTAHRALPRWHVGIPDQPVDLAPPGVWDIVLEDGSRRSGEGPLPMLPIGRHRLSAGGEVCWLLIAPPALPLPPRGWGVTVPLYGLRGPERGGVGDYADLAQTAEALGAAGAGFIGINPVHARLTGDPGAISPYSPSHRRRFSTAHLAFPGAAPPPAPFVDYPAARDSQRTAAAQAYAHAADAAGFEAFLAQEGAALTRFATYQAIAERYGAYWTEWPAAFQTPDHPEVVAFAAANGDRLRFHAWLQFQADCQLAEAAEAAQSAGMAHGLYLDLAVGTHPAGAETWADRASFALGASLGAPPDAFAVDGQWWNLAPFNPNALIDQGFAPLAETLRCQLRHARLLRIDHILGFERAFWVPGGGVPGAYVQMPRDAMLAVARIEAARVGATIVGEDLGNIPPGLQTALAASGILGCRVAMFETETPAAAYPEAVLASFGTHDLPTFVGWREGRDITARAEIGSLDPHAAEAAQAHRAHETARLGAETADDVHRFLAETPARLIALQIEDILGVADQPNLPGTVYEYPNWRRVLPVAGAALGGTAELARAAEIMAASGR